MKHRSMYNRRVRRAFTFVPILAFCVICVLGCGGMGGSTGRGAVSGGGGAGTSPGGGGPVFQADGGSGIMTSQVDSHDFGKGPKPSSLCTQLQSSIYMKDDLTVSYDTATKGVLRRVVWTAGTQPDDWRGYAPKYVIDNIKIYGIAETTVQAASWREFPISIDNATGSMKVFGTDQDLCDAVLEGITSPNYYDGTGDYVLLFWRPINLIPIVTSQPFTSLSEFMDLL